jgi:hypothetical protein
VIDLLIATVTLSGINLVLLVGLWAHTTPPWREGPKNGYAAIRPAKTPECHLGMAGHPSAAPRIERDDVESAVGELLEEDGPRATITALDYWLSRSSTAKHQRRPGS